MSEKLDQKIMPCSGGMVAFGLTGMDNTVYRRAFMGCHSEFQDELYGKGNRVHNAQGGKNEGSFRCTVCGNGKGVVRP